MIHIFKSSIFNKILIVGIFFLITPVALFTCMYALFITSHVEANAQSSVLGDSNSGKLMQVFAPLPDDFPAFDVEIEKGDGRIELLRQYLKRYNSPLYPYAQLIVDTAYKYGIDWRLITAIAQQESNLCKKIPSGSFNCWGWGIHSRGTLGFDSYEEGIETVSKGIKDNYVDKGLDSVEKIMAKYTPLSNGSWAFGVEKFIDQMR